MTNCSKSLMTSCVIESCVPHATSRPVVKNLHWVSKNVNNFVTLVLKMDRILYTADTPSVNTIRHKPSIHGHRSSCHRRLPQTDVLFQLERTQCTLHPNVHRCCRCQHNRAVAKYSAISQLYLQTWFA